jgi:RHS repeat-associated protein
MADGGFMQVALNSSSPRRLSSRASTASTSSSTSTTTTITFSVWDGDWAVLEEYTTGNVLVESYVQGYHGLVKTLVSNIYYYQDELGSTSHVAGGTGALIESYQYDLYGKPRVYNSGGTYQPNAIPLAKDLGNGGGRWIPEIGLYDDRNRFMSPDLGRFLQPDPIGFKGDASNLYRYVGNDWANRTDPTGLGEKESNPILQEQIRYNEQLRNSDRGAIMGQMLNVGRINVRDAVKDMGRAEAPNVSLTVRAEIRSPDPQSGVKTNQTVTVNQFGTASETHYVGYETGPFNTRLNGRGWFDSKVTPVKGKENAYEIKMTGYAYAIPVAATAKILHPGNPIPAIHYSFNGTINFGKGQATLSGSHSSYPSFEGQINGRTVFDRFQSRPPLIPGLLPGFEANDHGESHF